MAKSSKNVDDLLGTINSQEEQLNRYKKRLQGDLSVIHFDYARICIKSLLFYVVLIIFHVFILCLLDVVIAHKKLMTEKCRLEETLKTVTDVKSTNVDGDPVTDNVAEVFCRNFIHKMCKISNLSIAFILYAEEN